MRLILLRRSLRLRNFRGSICGCLRVNRNFRRRRFTKNQQQHNDEQHKARAACDSIRRPPRNKKPFTALLIPCSRRKSTIILRALWLRLRWRIIRKQRRAFLASLAAGLLVSAVRAFQHRPVCSVKMQPRNTSISKPQNHWTAIMECFSCEEPVRLNSHK